MTIDKRINYDVQGGAKNYLGKQKEVKAPIKWKSSPDSPETELAYITKAEKDLLIKKNLHGSLKKGANKGPSGIISLDGQGDYTRDRSPGAYDSGSASKNSGGNTQQNLRDRAMNEKNMKELLTGQKNIGQTTMTGPRTRQYGDLPEYMNIKQPDGTYKRKYVGSAYKSYGTPSFFGNLFSRAAPGYRGIQGLSAFGPRPTFESSRGPEGTGELGYYTDDEDFATINDAFPSFGILGILKAISKKFNKPKTKDMSEFNKLSLTPPENQKVYIPQGMNSSTEINDPFGKLMFQDEQKIFPAPTIEPNAQGYLYPTEGITGVKFPDQTDYLNSYPERENLRTKSPQQQLYPDAMVKLTDPENREYMILKTGEELDMNNPKQKQRLQKLEEKKNEAMFNNPSFSMFS